MDIYTADGGAQNLRKMSTDQSTFLMTALLGSEFQRQFFRDPFQIGSAHTSISMVFLLIHVRSIKDYVISGSWNAAKVTSVKLKSSSLAGPSAENPHLQSIWSVLCPAHDVFEGLVDQSKCRCLSWQLPLDICSIKDSFQSYPALLNLQPGIQSSRESAQLPIQTVHICSAASSSNCHL